MYFDEAPKRDLKDLYDYRELALFMLLNRPRGRRQLPLRVSFRETHD